ncbi:methyltransferase family protein [Hoeflea marina]|uniref:Methyltransferase family protein n=1 Tax=Hoeflea marina TaxID=274592 RepID=A0A317PMG1_9HYPH|nr:class I SAM-dependent methyltransferase [Hoeflea marina]PWW00227.1 methyltransferase family protein [Hoeflea marina]
MARLINKFISSIRDTTVADIDVDGDHRLAIHARIFESKPLLRSVFSELHRTFIALDEKYLSGDGLRIEIGAGVAPVRDLAPDVLATDIVPGPGLDRVLDAQAMDLADSSVRTIFGQNCFHHLPDPEAFFRECERVLKPGGGVILLEPYHGPFGSFLFKRLFTTEGFDKRYPSWQTPVAGPMNGANQALSYIVFKRDRDEFTLKFPALRIVHEQTCSNYLKYLASGGLNFRQLCPNWAIPAVSLLQFMLFPLNRWLALHHIIVLRKEP